MKYSNTCLLLLLFAFFTFITLPGCCKASKDCADGACAAQNGGDADDCVCLTIASQDLGVDPDGNDVWCESCVVYCLPCDVVEQAKAEHQSCGIAVCPAVQHLSLEKAPLCADCKKLIMKWADLWKKCEHCGKKEEPCKDCTEKMHKCKVKDLTCKESLKANSSCKQCPKVMKKAGLVRQLQQTCHSKKVKTSQNNDGTVWILLTDEEEFPVIDGTESRPSAKPEADASKASIEKPSAKPASESAAHTPAGTSAAGASVQQPSVPAAEAGK